MEILKYLWETPELKFLILILLGIIVLIFIILFCNHLFKIKKGISSKFLWFETKFEEVDSNDKEQNNTIKGKNINTGSNYGKIGDN